MIFYRQVAGSDGALENVGQSCAVTAAGGVDRKRRRIGAVAGDAGAFDFALEEFAQRRNVHAADDVAQRNRLIFAGFGVPLGVLRAGEHGNVAVAGAVDEDVARNDDRARFVRRDDRFDRAVFDQHIGNEGVIEKLHARFGAKLLQRYHKHRRVKGAAGDVHAAVGLQLFAQADADVRAGGIVGDVRVHQRGDQTVGRAAAERAELLDDEDALAAFRRGNGSEHARRAAAADDDVRFVSRAQLALRDYKCFHKIVTLPFCPLRFGDGICVGYALRSLWHKTA